MRFKRVYIEITNICNLKCPFCLPHNRKEEFMSIEKFEYILNQIKDYTNYIYLHIKGEPLLHPNIKDIIKLAYDKGFYINITTNGTLISNILDMTKYIRQINISLHSTKNIDIINSVRDIKDCMISLRLWNSDKDNIEMINKIEQIFGVNIDSSKRLKLTDNIFLSQEEEFIWPSLNNEFNSDKGCCLGLKNQLRNIGRWNYCTLLLR